MKKILIMLGIICIILVSGCTSSDSEFCYNKCCEKEICKNRGFCFLLEIPQNVSDYCIEKCNIINYSIN